MSPTPPSPEFIELPSFMLAKIEELRTHPAADWKDPGLRIVLSYRINLSGPGVWGASIAYERLTKSGNPGKPEQVILLTADLDESPAALLRQVADLIDPAGPELAVN